MLPSEHRLTDAPDFRRASRGRRAGSRSLVVHVAMPTGSSSVPVARIGFVVGKGVGGAVVRNRVRRRLRHLVRDRLSGFPVGGLITVRALPPSAGLTTSELAVDLDRCLSRTGMLVGHEPAGPSSSETAKA